MNYRVIVTRLDMNPDYEEQMRASAERQLRGFFNDATTSPQRFLEARTLDVVLEEHEYEVLKRAVIEVWK